MLTKLFSRVILVVLLRLLVLVVVNTVLKRMTLLAMHLRTLQLIFRMPRSRQCLELQLRWSECVCSAELRVKKSAISLPECRLVLEVRTATTSLHGSRKATTTTIRRKSIENNNSFSLLLFFTFFFFFMGNWFCKLVLLSPLRSNQRTWSSES